MSRFEPIAIVGQACVLPGALDPDGLWTAVVEGRQLLSDVPPGRWRIDRALLPALAERGGFVSGFEDRFDASGFALPAEEILPLDPLFHWVLHVAREALRDAGHDTEKASARAGLILGNLSFPTDALSRFAEATWLDGLGDHFLDGDARRLSGLDAPDPRNRFVSGLPALLAARALRLGAGAFALDAACASSLYAIKLACDALHDRRADMMLAGGVTRSDDLFLRIGFSALGALSPSGRSRPFQKDADGLLPGEGAALVALTRLADAARAGQRILGVIRGIGLGNDGRGAGFLSPHEDGQRLAMEAAYRAAGLRPCDVSLLECHATGTPVGDTVEVRSSAAVFAEAESVAAGSLKGNLGHLFAAAGAAGLLKIVAAIRARTLPPASHADQPHPALVGSPLRLLAEAEPWPDSAPRRAAVSAFGFGGNNAHLIVEEWRPESPAAFPVAAGAAAAPELAIVGMSVLAAGGETPEFLRALFSGESRLRPGADGRPAGAARDVELDLEGLRTPPRDLERALAQQCLVLKAALEARSQVGALPAERTAVLVGMQCDGAVTLQGVRVRLAEWARAWRAERGASATPEWLRAAQAAVVDAADAAAVVGMLPNMPANRLNSLLGLSAPGFTVSAEELSGVTALALAARALQRGEIDAALVGAVDVGCEPVHARAAAHVLGAGREAPGDAAVVLVLKRLDDARRDGDSVHAVLGEDGEPSFVQPSLSPLLGHAHAAAGLLEVAAAAASCRHRARPAAAGTPAMPWLPAERPRRAGVEVTGLAGARARLTLAVDDHAPPEPVLLEPVPRLHVFSGADRRDVLESLRAGREGDGGPARLVVVAGTDDERGERCELARLALLDGGGAALPAGVAFQERPVPGELAFVFTGPAGAYRGMGRELLLGLPELLAPVAASVRDLERAAGWLFDGAQAEPDPSAKLWGSSLLCQVHATLSRDVLGLRPHAAIGMCAGETNALFALGAWSDIEALERDIEQAGVYARELAGEFQAVRRAWGGAGRVDWSNWRVLAPVAAVRAALSGETRVHLMIVNAPDDCVIGGEQAAGLRVVERIGAARARPLGYDIAIHCPEAAAFRDDWRRLHHRPTRAVEGVRFYTHATLGSYAPSADAVADALTGQAMGTVDFPALIQRAWDDGVRQFLEHGPQAGCTRWISKILAGRPHVAAALDVPGESSLRQAANAAAQLLAAGVPVDHSAFASRLARAVPQPARRPARSVVVPAHRAWGLPAQLALRSRPQPMAAAPRLPDAVAPPPPRPRAAPRGDGVSAVIAAHHRDVSLAHRAFLAAQAQAQLAFLSGRSLFPAVPAPAAPSLTVAPSPARLPAAPLRLSRAQLEVLASGRISSVLGPRFAFQDDYRRQVRMPEPPLLLTDRVLEIAAEPLSMGLGSIRTESDVREGSWYLHHGRMPPGLMIEAGQADLLLISWLGVDQQNRGERVYRLLGSEITFHGSPARPGETLAFDIAVERHARQGDVRLFFFRSECHVDGRLRISVRDGQAGFFDDEELRTSGGVLWEAESARPGAVLRTDPPAVEPTRARFDAEAVRAFAQGRVAECFGPGYELAETHVRTPRVPDGDMLLFHEVEQLDPRGGPWGRGYLRARLPITPDAWFFRGHFKDDPCMPGTLMFDGCYQVMAFYLAALGFTLPNDGWRFEPVPERPIQLRCRGQVIPSSRELVYEVFVEGISAGPHPTLFAQVMCTVDGLKACHCAGIALRLVPDWPLASRPELLAGHVDRGPVASLDGFRFGYAAMLASAWGPPSQSFGAIYEDFDARRLPRLPGPPYHFLSRIAAVEGPLGRVQSGTRIEAHYDVPEDAWFFAENGHPTMPWCVFLEVGLQPCGWLAMSTGAPREFQEDLRFRNLDGTATWTREIAPGAGTLATRVRLKDVSRSAGIVIVAFEVEQTQGEQVVCRMDTVFGFFPSAAFEDQPGLPTSDEERAWLERPSEFVTDLASRPERFFAGSLRLPGKKLMMLDRVTGWWPEAGRAGKGRLRAEKRVDAGEWFFKAHFFQDPVQPGSLGLEAMVQLLQFYVIASGLADGLPSPRFEPLDLGRTLRWKYRGQVVPSNRTVVVEVEVTETGRDGRGVYAVADAWLWVDGKRIYSASNLGVRAVPGAADAAPPRPSAFDSTGARAFWRRRLGTGSGLAEDLVDGLAAQFVGDVVVADETLRALRGRPAIFLANHQVGVESLLFATLAAGLNDRVVVALAKAEHRESWMGRLMRLIAQQPGVADPRTLAFFDRSDSASLLPILEQLRHRLQHEDASLLVHVEGTRSLAARRPVAHMSGVWIDLALAAGAPIVPVRFSGGLPLQEADARLEFPVGFGRQDYHVGRPLPPDELLRLDLAARQRRVLDAINELGPREEMPGDPDHAFPAAVDSWRGRARSAERAVLLAALANVAAPSDEGRRLLEAPERTAGWLAEMTRFLFDAD